MTESTSPAPAGLESHLDPFEAPAAAIAARFTQRATFDLLPEGARFVFDYIRRFGERPVLLADSGHSIQVALVTPDRYGREFLEEDKHLANVRRGERHWCAFPYHDGLAGVWVSADQEILAEPLRLGMHHRRDAIATMVLKLQTRFSVTEIRALRGMIDSEYSELARPLDEWLAGKEAA